MVLRLVLVGIVAGLGVSPPAECELAGWTRSVQTRLVVWLAKANVAEPLVENVDDRDSRGLDEQVLALELEEPETDRPEAKVPALVVDVDVEAETETDTIVDAEEDALAEPIVDATDEADFVAEEAVAPIEGTKDAEAPAFDAIVEEMVADFTRLAEAKAASDAIEMELGLAGAMDLMPEATDAAPVTTAPVVPATEVDQPEAVADLYPGEAFALNRMADGLDDAAPAEPADAAIAPPAGHQLSNAVRLTRDAVYAWMNLIQSPAIVTISR